MATLPTFPTFTDGTAPSITDLNHLSNAAKFLTVCDQAQSNTTPMFLLTKSNTQAISATTLTQVQYGVVLQDTDSMFNSSTTPVNINTRGYYRFAAGVPTEVTGTNKDIRLYFRADTSSSNVSHPSSSVIFGWQSQATSVDTAITTAHFAAGPCPWVLYPGDQVALYIYEQGGTGTTITLDTTDSGAGYPTFTGKWFSYGT